MEAVQNYTGNSGPFLRLQTPVTLLQPKGYPSIVSLWIFKTKTQLIFYCISSPAKHKMILFLVLFALHVFKVGISEGLEIGPSLFKLLEEAFNAMLSLNTLFLLSGSGKTSWQKKQNFWDKLFIWNVSDRNKHDISRVLSHWNK